MRTNLLISSIALSAVYALTLPYLLNIKIESEIKVMREGNAQEIRAAAKRLKYVAPLANFNSLAGLDCEENNPEKNKALFESYRDLTGENLESKNYIICNDF